MIFHIRRIYRKISEPHAEGKSIQGASLKVFASLLNKGGAFLLMPFLTKFMSPSEFGEVSLLTTYSGFVSLFAFGTFVSYQANYNKLNSTPGEIQSYAYSFTLIQVAAICFLFLVTGLGLGRNFFIAVIGCNFKTPILLLAVSFGAFQIITNTFETHYTMTRRFAFSAAGSVFSFVIGSAATILLLLSTADKVSGRLLGLAAGGFASIIWSAPLIGSIFNTKFNSRYALDAIKVGGPIMLNGAIFYLINTCDRFILAKFLDTTAVGIYSFAFSISASVNLFSTALSTTYCSDYYSNQNNPDIKSLQKTAHTYISAMYLISILAAAWFPVVIRFAFNARYHESASLVSMQCGGIGIYMLFSVLSQEFNGRKQTIWIPFFTSFTAGISILLNIILVPKYGVIATAWNLLLSYLILGLSTLFIALRLFNNIALKVSSTLISTTLYIVAIGVLSTTDNSSLFSFMLKAAISILATLAVWKSLSRILKKQHVPSDPELNDG